MHGQTMAKEIGIRLGSFSGYDLLYKKQKSETQYSRFRLSNAKLELNKIANLTAYDFFINFGLGLENRVPLGNNFAMVHGWEPSLGFGFSGSGKLETININPRIGYIFGFMYSINNKFAISIESVPSLYISTSIEVIESKTNSSINRVGFDYSSSLISLSMVGRF